MLAELNNFIGTIQGKLAGGLHLYYQSNGYMVWSSYHWNVRTTKVEKTIKKKNSISGYSAEHIFTCQNIQQMGVKPCVKDAVQNSLSS